MVAQNPVPIKFITYALLVGVSDYEHHDDLVNPTIDVRAIEKELHEAYKCKTQKLINPTRAQFRNALLRQAQRKYAPDDQLLVFFSGHGWFDKMTRRGYLAFKDSQPLEYDTFFSSYLSHQEVHSLLEQVNCKRILLIVDACISNRQDMTIAMAKKSFHEKGIRGRDLHVVGASDERINGKPEYRTRRYITAGGAEYIPGERPGHHSPLAQGILTALRSFGGEDRILTLKEMMSKIETINPAPRIGEFAGNEPGSTFILLSSSNPQTQTTKPQTTKPESTHKAEMIFIPAGEFQMGISEAQIRKMQRDNPGLEASWFDDVKPIHTVYLNAFYIDKYEVTNQQYAKFLNEYEKNTAAVNRLPVSRLIDLDDESCLIERSAGVYQPKTGYENHPVIMVSWYGAAAYAQFNGKRLPTEAEWEKAARGGLVGKRYPWGDELNHDYANYFGIGGRDKWDGTSPVGSFPANGYGLHDMTGNVWEWCADRYASNYYNSSPKKQPVGPGVPVLFVDNDFTRVKGDRVCRGGSWDDDPGFLDVAHRYKHYPAYKLAQLGFRCVLSASKIPQ